MATVTRRIGLSLGADVCWPICYEHVMNRLDLAIPIDGDTVRFETERLTIEPFDLRQPCSYDLVIDRLTHWFHLSREWIKKAIIMDGLYVFNNPWAVQSMEKQSTYCAMMRLGLPVPDTWMLPSKSYEPSPDLEPTLNRYARLFSLSDIGRKIGYPVFMKPYDGGGWVGVTKIDDEKDLQKAYDESGHRVMQVQKAVLPFDLYVRSVGLGPQVRHIRYEPSAPLHARYTPDTTFLTADEQSLLRDMTLTINAFFGWDFNSCEALRQEGIFYPIDFANPCPDSQVTSLHYHFPWIVASNVRWSVFCAATKRRMRQNLDWQPFFEIADRGLEFRERLAAYAAIADERLETARFEEFCVRHLGNLDEVVWEFFGTPIARDAIWQKVKWLYPPHEVEEFTEHFWTLVQRWRRDEEVRPGGQDTPTGGGDETNRKGQAEEASSSPGGVRPATRRRKKTRQSSTEAEAS